MKTQSLTMLATFLFYCCCLLSLLTAQEILRYTKEEESGDVFIGDIIRDYRLDEEYTQEELDSMSFVFVESDEAHQDLFNIRGGILETKGPVDRDNICPHLEICVIHVSIKVQPSQFFAIIQIEVEIIDLNDNIPTFSSGTQEVTISESTVVGSLSNLPQAQDNDSPVHSIQRYEMSPPSLVFRLNQETIGGIVRVQLEVLQQLDREQQDSYTFTLFAYDGGSNIQSSSVDIAITVSDSNDNRPVFSQPEYELNVLENVSAGFSIARVTASDVDIGTNAEIVYSFDSDTTAESGHLFRIDSQTGQIFLRETLDYETKTSHVLTVLAKDNYPEYTGALAVVEITVMDYNDNRPSIKVNDLLDGGTVQVPENAPIEHFVAHLTVTDADSGDNGVFQCSIEGDNFVLERLYPTEFKIITDVSFDRETRSQYTIRMSCQDNGSPRLASSLTIPVIIGDQNDQVPIFQSSTFVGNTLENTTPGSFIMRVTATDDDIGLNGEIEYHLDDGPIKEIFNVGLLSGNVSAKINLDHERESRYTFVVTAIDRGVPRLSSTATVIIDIVDVDDNVPLFSRNSYTFSVVEHELNSTEVGTVYATDADAEPFNFFQYSLPSNDIFRIDSENGTIFTKITLDREEYTEPVFTTEVYAISSGFRSTTSTALVTIHIEDINDHDPIIIFPNLQNNTLYIDRDIRRGDVVGYVWATDGDDGNNARLTYSVVSGNTDNYFLIDAADGTIQVHKSLASVNSQAFGLVVRVHDSGSIPKHAEAYLNIVVNKSKGDKDEITNTNLSIVVSIACVSGVVIVILIVAIVFIIIQRRRQNQKSRYNNVPKVLNGDPFKQIQPHSQFVHDKSSSQLVRSFDNSGYSEDTTGNQKDNQRQFYDQRDQMPRDSDQESACSADVSNTDSGRGSNEDFNHDKKRHASGDTSTSRNALPSSSSYNAKSSNQRHNVSADGVVLKANPHTDRYTTENTAINKHDSWQIGTANLQSGAYHARDYQSRHSFNSKNISHPSPLLDDPLYGDRRRQVLYRDMSPSHHHKNNTHSSHQPTETGANSNNYVMLSGVPHPNGKLHEVHV